MFVYKKLEKFTYHLIKNGVEIKKYLNKWLVKEWKQDIQEFPDQPWSREWLNLISLMEFRLVKIPINGIKQRQDLMEYRSESYNFTEHLLERVKEMEESILQGSSISPLVVNGENMELMDGYTRYTVLKNHEMRFVYVYLGKKGN